MLTGPGRFLLNTNLKIMYAESVNGKKINGTHNSASFTISYNIKTKFFVSGELAHWDGNAQEKKTNNCLRFGRPPWSNG